MPLPPALRYPNYRLYFLGQGLSVLGTWMQRVAMHWLVYRLSGSELLLGLSGFLSQIPVLVLGPFGGLLADSVNRRRFLMYTQAFAMVQASVLAYLTLRGSATVWHVLPMSLVLGLINALDTPLRQSFVSELVEDRRHLPNAIALNSLTNNTGRLVGPSVAGIVIAVLSEGACFVFNALSYLAVLCALWRMRIEERPRPRTHRNVWEGLKAGAQYVAGSPVIRRLLALLACMAFMATPYTVMMPVFATHVLKGGPHTMGYMLSSAGVGAVIGTVYLAWHSSVTRLPKLLGCSMAAAGAALVVFSQSRWIALSIPMMAVVGFGIIVTGASVNTIVQTIVDDSMRGRVMSFYTMSFMGVAPLGAVTMGALAQATNVQIALGIGGCACLAAAAHFLWGLQRFRAALPDDQEFPKT